MSYQQTMILKKKKNMIKIRNTNNQITFEYQDYPECTVVALEATLDDFKGQPVVVDGKPHVRFAERTIKDCTKIDGCIYFHKGRVSDSLMCDLIEKFNKLKKEHKEWKSSGRLILRDNKIKI